MASIGNIKLGKYPLLLAPMDGVSDPPFRYICKSLCGSIDLMYSEFIASEGLIRNAKKSIKKLDIYDYERPIGIQLFGKNIDSMVRAAKLAEQAKPDLIDINFGCPVKKVAARGEGAGMLKDISQMVKITSEIVKATKLPITVKTRLGWDESSKNIVEISERLQDAGIKAITIHGRTRMQMLKGTSDWTLIGEVKNNPRIKIPVFGNGDIDSPEKAKLMFDKYGIDGIMIGRASIGKPWIFKEIRHYLDTGEKLPTPAIEQKVEMAKLHLNKSVEYKGEPTGIYEMRRYFSNYFKALTNFKEIRLRLLTCCDYNEILEILNEISVKYGEK